MLQVLSISKDPIFLDYIEVVTAVVVSQGASTVNSEIFARTLFSRNFAYAKFRENKTFAKRQNHSVVH